MKVAVLGGGPAGLYFAISMKRRNPAHEITVFERNRPDDTFGWGVVLSDETLDNLAANDPVSAACDPRALRLLGRHRRHLHAARAPSRPATASAASAASTLLLLLQARARELGVELRFETEVDEPQPLMRKTTTWWSPPTG